MEATAKWLVTKQLKPKMQFWVEMHLKYENELENYEPTEDGLIDTKK